MRHVLLIAMLAATPALAGYSWFAPTDCGLLRRPAFGAHTVLDENGSRKIALLRQPNGENNGDDLTLQVEADDGSAPFVLARTKPRMLDQKSAKDPYAAMEFLTAFIPAAIWDQDKKSILYVGAEERLRRMKADGSSEDVLDAGGRAIVSARNGAWLRLDGKGRVFLPIRKERRAEPQPERARARDQPLSLDEIRERELPSRLKSEIEGIARLDLRTGELVFVVAPVLFPAFPDDEGDRAVMWTASCKEAQLPLIDCDSYRGRLRDGCASARGGQLGVGMILLDMRARGWTGVPSSVETVALEQLQEDSLSRAARKMEQGEGAKSFDWRSAPKVERTVARVTDPDGDVAAGSRVRLMARESRRSPVDGREIGFDDKEIANGIGIGSKSGVGSVLLVGDIRDAGGRPLRAFVRSANDGVELDLSVTTTEQTSEVAEIRIAIDAADKPEPSPSWARIRSIAYPPRGFASVADVRSAHPDAECVDVSYQVPSGTWTSCVVKYVSAVQVVGGAPPCVSMIEYIFRDDHPYGVHTPFTCMSSTTTATAKRQAFEQQLAPLIQAFPFQLAHDTYAFMPTDNRQRLPVFRLELTQSGRSITGKLLHVDGIELPVTGEMTRSGMSLSCETKSAFPCRITGDWIQNRDFQFEGALQFTPSGGRSQSAGVRLVAMPSSGQPTPSDKPGRADLPVAAYIPRASGYDAVYPVVPDERGHQFGLYYVVSKQQKSQLAVEYSAVGRGYSKEPSPPSGLAWGASESQVRKKLKPGARVDVDPTCSFDFLGKGKTFTCLLAHTQALESWFVFSEGKLVAHIEAADWPKTKVASGRSSIARPDAGYPNRARDALRKAHGSPSFISSDGSTMVWRGTRTNLTFINLSREQRTITLVGDVTNVESRLAFGIGANAELVVDELRHRDAMSARPLATALMATSRPVLLPAPEDLTSDGEPLKDLRAQGVRAFIRAVDVDGDGVEDQAAFFSIAGRPAVAVSSAKGLLGVLSAKEISGREMVFGFVDPQQQPQGAQPRQATLLIATLDVPTSIIWASDAPEVAEVRYDLKKKKLLGPWSK